jgi:hypothetical protein
VTGDLGVDGDAGPFAEPGLEDAVDPIPVAGDQGHLELVARLPTDPGDGRATATTGGDPEAVQLAAVADRGSIRETAASRKLGSLAGLTLQVTPDPGLAAS